jgi:hypothetical protein
VTGTISIFCKRCTAWYLVNAFVQDDINQFLFLFHWLTQLMLPVLLPFLNSSCIHLQVPGMPQDAEAAVVQLVAAEMEENFHGD